jgi:hypothetical protein
MLCVGYKTGQFTAFTDEKIVSFIARMPNTIYIWLQNEWRSRSEQRTDNVSSLHQWRSHAHVP